MPIYEYYCETGHEFEVLQKISDPPLDICTICSKKAWRKISLSNHPKGSGVYLFDRRFGGKDVLHDPAFSDRERREIFKDVI